MAKGLGQVPVLRGLAREGEHLELCGRRLRRRQYQEDGFNRLLAFYVDDSSA